MGGACSRKRDQRDNEDILHRGVSGRYCKSGSSKWLATSFSRPAIDIQLGRGKCPSLLDLCIRKICEVFCMIYYMLVEILTSCISAYHFCSFSTRTLIDITPFICFQGILVSRSLMNWYIPNIWLMFLSKPFEIVLSRYNNEWYEKLALIFFFVYVSHLFLVCHAVL